MQWIALRLVVFQLCDASIRDRNLQMMTVLIEAVGFRFDQRRSLTRRARVLLPPQSPGTPLRSSCPSTMTPGILKPAARRAMSGWPCDLATDVEIA